MESVEKYTHKLSFADDAPEVWRGLQELPRTGWLKRGIPNPETVAEHTLALIKIGESFPLLSQEEKEELCAMLEVHDWAEVVVGDLVILESQGEDKSSERTSKFEQEKAVMESISKTHPNGERLLSLWMRFETSDDALAVLAREIDKYQAVEKALEYEVQYKIKVFEEFYTYEVSKNRILNPELVKRMDLLAEKHKLHNV
jgi:5'-deoxynucleotidase YfbR-like HD superfamily hydrolase